MRDIRHYWPLLFAVAFGGIPMNLWGASAVAEPARAASKGMSIKQLHKQKKADGGLASLIDTNRYGKKVADLSGSGLTDISDIEFLLTIDPAIEILLLNDNAITTIPYRLFESFTQLSILVLAGNPGLICEMGAFEGLGGLTLLDLSCCQLDDSAFGTGVFYDLTKLRTLFLGSNNLTTLPDLSRQEYLETLDISGNRLTVISRESLKYQVNLEILYAHNNQLTRLTSAAVPGVSGECSARMLRFDGNNLSTIDEQFFQRLPGICVVDLQDNKGLKDTITDIITKMERSGYGQFEQRYTDADGTEKSRLIPVFCGDGEVIVDETEEDLKAMVTYMYAKIYEDMTTKFINLLKENGMLTDAHISRWLICRQSVGTMRTDSCNRWVFLNRHKGKIIFGFCLAIGIAVGVGAVALAGKAAVGAGGAVKAMSAGKVATTLAAGAAIGGAVGGVTAWVCPDDGDYVLEQEDGTVFCGHRHKKTYTGVCKTVALLSMLKQYLAALTVYLELFAHPTQVDLHAIPVKKLRPLFKRATHLADPYPLYFSSPAEVFYFLYRLLVPNAINEMKKKGPRDLFTQSILSLADYAAEENLFPLIGHDIITDIVRVVLGIQKGIKSFRNSLKHHYTSLAEVQGNFKDKNVLEPLTRSLALLTESVLEPLAHVIEHECKSDEGQFGEEIAHLQKLVARAGAALTIISG